MQEGKNEYQHGYDESYRSYGNFIVVHRSIGVLRYGVPMLHL